MNSKFKEYLEAAHPLIRTGSQVMQKAYDDLDSDIHKSHDLDPYHFTKSEKDIRNKEKSVGALKSAVSAFKIMSKSFDEMLESIYEAEEGMDDIKNPSLRLRVEKVLQPYIDEIHIFQKAFKRLRELTDEQQYQRPDEYIKVNI